MTDESFIKLNLLKLESLIQSKRFVNNCAERDLVTFGEWQVDIPSEIKEINEEIDRLIKMIEEATK